MKTSLPQSYPFVKENFSYTVKDYLSKGLRVTICKAFATRSL